MALRNYGVVLLLAGVTAMAEPTSSPPAVADVIKAISATTSYREVAIAADARTVAWVEALPPTATATAVGTAIYVAPAAHAEHRVRVTARSYGAEEASAGSDERAIAWAPDSRSLAFLSDARSPGQLQLYSFKLSDHSVRALTSLKGYLATPRWSPDGGTLAILYTENAARAAGPLAAVAPEVGVIGQEILEQRLVTVDLASLATTPVSPADLYVYEYDWSPDGREFTATAAHGSGDNNWYVAELYVIDIAAKTARSILKPDMQIAVPRWSPDGRSVAFIGGLMSDEPIASGDVYVMPASGGTPRNLTANQPLSALWISWRRDGKAIWMATAQDGGSSVAAVGLADGRIETLRKGAEVIHGPADYGRGLSPAADGGASAVIRESFNEPPAIWVGRTGYWHRFTTPAPVLGGLWGAVEDVRWENDGLPMQGWLLPPARVDPSRKYPMVVWVHGGPAWLNAPAWPSDLGDGYASVLATRGYYVFFPNPRGSAGFGERFKRANVKDFGGGDLRDILSGVDRVVATRPIDDHRVGITGWSYGGFMTMWAVTQTNRFRAAVVGAGLSNWLSYYGENGIDEWMIPYFGASVYDDPAVYAKSSPINFVKHVRTPTQIIVGDSDVECPPPQSYEFWHALRAFNVKTQLIVYPHEGHLFSDPTHVRDRIERLVSWFDENMPRDAER